MTAAPYSIDPTTYLDDLLAQASPDLMRQMLQGFINQILSAQADTVCGAEYGVASTERVNHRNGYRHRDLDTRVGTIDVAVPVALVDPLGGCNPVFGPADGISLCGEDLVDKPLQHLAHQIRRRLGEQIVQIGCRSIECGAAVIVMFLSVRCGS